MTQSEAVVYVVEDDPTVRSALKLVFRSERLRAEIFESAEAFLAAPRAAGPACLVLDLHLPGLGGLGLLERLRQESRPLPVVVLSATDDVGDAIGALKGGVADFIRKPFEREALLASVGRALDQARGDWLRAERIATVAQHYAMLSPRERQVMEQVVAGLTNRAIAAQLGISERTVEVHRGEVMGKMEASSVAHLVEMALQLKSR